ncbi:50S ribosomal protein L10 [Candidatus Kinetoplastibacterium sorsogonicusi]|uniref:Large ribosomal subunit protein uL10 n=1 Tax=Candidatus Kinetoplastidibacterium kentomonadis TaxID=1576550 RepID=A0A3Q8F445_9PROT|nr:50S ribosomal protein L10 [Candidatus Kinetoplastibacterium sorsogonicusi]AWD32806.1 50S ribosomal protein L10 [Candidatus Kinetoplastibacterium sorsogonicusi]
MSLNRQEKAAVIEEISAQIAIAQSIIVAEYRGLEVSSITSLRKDARASGVYLRVLKNSLASIAVKGTDFEILSDQFTGPLIYSISSDPVSAAKIIAKFAKNNDKLVIKSGALNNHLLTKEEIIALSSMPSKEELISTLLSAMQAPIVKFVRTINEVPSSFVRCLSAIRDSKIDAK